MSIELLKEKCKNERLYRRYEKFILERLNRKIMPHEIYHAHHILPKAKDMFPEYKNFNNYCWNKIFLTPREHFIAHWMLAKMFPNSSQTRAFYYMCNKVGKKASKQYAIAKFDHTTNMKSMYTEERNRKISIALIGKPKSKEHVSKLMGHEVKSETREKLRLRNTGKKHTEETKKKMSTVRTGIKKAPHSTNGKENISQSKKQANLKWYNDGHTSKLFSVPPSGWSKGRLPWIR